MYSYKHKLNTYAFKKIIHLRARYLNILDKNGKDA